MNLTKIIKEFGNGNSERACRMLFDYFYDRLVTFALLFVKFQEAAEVVVSEVFIRLFRSPESIPSIQDINLETNQPVHPAARG